MKKSNPLLEAVQKQMVPIIFSIICILSIILAKQPMSFVVNEAFVRVSRNAILILSLIIPVLCGMGLNFSIVLGAMAGEISLILITHWEIQGIGGILVALVIATAISLVLGYFAGKLFNKVRGQEMIAGLILGYFATGIYDLVCMVLIGTVIPMNDPELMVGVTQADGSTSYVGLTLTINLLENTKYALDKLISFKFIDALPIFIVVSFVLAIVLFLYKLQGKNYSAKDSLRPAVYFAGIGVITLILQILIHTSKTFYAMFFMLNIPFATWIAITLVCLLIVYIQRTKLGQDIRAVGQNFDVAVAAGINGNRTRIIATILSTIIASWGQVVFLQNIGTIQTYYSHEQVGIYAVAAILVGGASIEKASIGSAFTGATLFHILFFTTPLAATLLLGNAQLGEYFRVFFCYGIIALSLLMFELRKSAEKRHRLKTEFGRAAKTE